MQTVWCQEEKGLDRNPSGNGSTGPATQFFVDIAGEAG